MISKLGCVKVADKNIVLNLVLDSLSKLFLIAGIN